jgi:hypothetical protein
MGFIFSRRRHEVRREFAAQQDVKSSKAIQLASENYGPPAERASPPESPRIYLSTNVSDRSQERRKPDGPFPLDAWAELPRRRGLLTAAANRVKEFEVSIAQPMDVIDCPDGSRVPNRDNLQVGFGIMNPCGKSLIRYWASKSSRTRATPAASSAARPHC